MRALLAVALAAAGARAGAADAPMAPITLQQIGALIQEKEARTPAQRKLDSHLIYATRMSRGEPVAPGVPVQRLSFSVEPGNLVLIDLKANVTPALLNQVRQAGTILDSMARYQYIRARVPLSQLEALAASPDVVTIRPAARAVANTGRLLSQGDVTHRAGLARTNYGVMGLGVKVGVLSDSVDYLQNSLASGDIPSVTVLPGQDGTTPPQSGEGTAMLEIVADLAPKAELYFATALGGFVGPARFAQNILDLRAVGCDVIVDDINFFVESPFQDDVISQAVIDVVASGAMYFSSAGNSGNANDGTSGVWEGDFADGGGVTVGGRMGTAHNFGGGIYNNIITGSQFPNTLLFWSDPLGASTNDYDLFTVDNQGTVVGSSTNPQNGTQDPYEDAGQGNAGDRISIVRFSGDARFLHLELIRGVITNQTAGTIRGHNTAPGSFGVAAVPVQPAFPGPFIGGTANPVETFSSDGPRRVFYDRNGAPLTGTNFLSTGGVVRNQPEITAADGVRTTTPGFDPFFGTSAAAPHAAAIAALIKSYNPALTVDQIRAVLTNSALDIEAPGMDRDSGWGIIMPGDALALVPPPRPVLVSSNLSGGNGNGIVDPDECNELTLLLKNNAATLATSVSAMLVSATPGVTVVFDTSAYPPIPPGGTAVNSVPFRLYTSSAFVCGTPINLTLRISSSLGGITNSFQIPSGVAGVPPVVVSSVAPVNIPDNNTNGIAIPLPVTGMFFPVGKVTVSLHALHEGAGDLTLQLESPDGTRVDLARRRGGMSPNYGGSCATQTKFDSAAATNIISGMAPFAGTFRPEQSLTAFNGKTGGAANGTWLLRVIDGLATLTGSVQCATLEISPALCATGSGDCSANLGVSITDTPDPVLVGSNLTYAIQITNRAPRLAPAATLLDTLPPGMTIVSVNSSAGSCNVSPQIINCSLGTIPANGGATVTVVVRAPVAGFITNRATVSSPVIIELNPADNTAVAVTTVQNPMPIIVPFATALLAESGPVNGGLDPGETVSLNFYLRNVGTLDTTNLVAKLLSSGGVNNPGAQQSYGALVANGDPGAQPFSFTAGGVPGGAVTASLQLQDGTNNLGVITFTIGLAGAATVVNQAVINIPDRGPALLYPSPLFVSGLAGVVTKVTATISNLNHSFPEDLDILLVSPAGRKVLLLSGAGASVDVTGATLHFDDAASNSVPLAGPIVSGTFRPTDYPDDPLDDTLPAPAPAGPYATTLSAFNGTAANGAWALYVADDFAGDDGRIAGGWSLSIITTDPINPVAELAVSVSDSPDPVKLGSNATYTVTVTNAGPEVALGVVLTNTLPPGLSLVSVTGGSPTVNGSEIVCDLGILAASNRATVTIVAQATGLGAQVFTARVSGGVTEFNLADNTATATTAIEANADLSVRLAASPATANVGTPLTYVLTVSNAGPNTAAGVSLTNVLPAGVANVTAPGCVVSGGVVTCDLGSLAPGASATVTVEVTTPAGVAPLTATASVGAASPDDPSLANNTATLTLDNINPLHIIVPAMTFLVYETGGVTNGGIEAGETVQINFGVRNLGTLPTVDLVGTLLPNATVTPLDPPRRFGTGVVETNGAAVEAAFTFLASGAPGTLLTASIQLQDGPLDLGTIHFIIPLGNQVRFASSAAVSVPEFGPAAPYPSIIDVTGLTGTVSKITVTLSNLVHTYPDDLDVLLVGPTNSVLTTARSAMLMSDVGGGNAVNGVTLTFDDEAAAPLPDSGLLASGAWQPSDSDATDLFPAPAPAAPYTSSLGVFSGQNPNGEWKLYVIDDTYIDSGTLSNGWSLDITTIGRVDPPPATLARGVFTPAGGFEFMLKGVVGGTYQIQASPDMRSWSTIGSAVLAPSNTIMFTDPAPVASGPRFYRAVHVP